MDALSRDIRFALRLVRKAPVLSMATIVTLAIGIGLNAGVFTVLSGLLLRPRVTVDPATFVHLKPEYSGTNVPRSETPALSTRDYLALRDRATTVRGLAAWTVRDTRIGEHAPFRELTLLVSCNFFDIYGLDRLERGRTFLQDECAQPAPPVAVISDEFWKRYLDANPGVLSVPLFVNGEAFTIVGVTPPDFAGRLRGDGIWLPYSWEPAVTRGRPAFADPATAWLWVDGRLKPGVPVDAVVAELNVLMRQQDTLTPGRTSAVSVNNGALIHEPAVRPVAMFVLPLVLGSVGLVLLIACANVTLLLLSRAIARQREIAIRLAIGCSRSRLVRMLLAESLLLAALGIPLSMWLAWQAPGVMRRLFPMMPYYPMRPDAAVLGYLLAASLAAGVGAGLAPALESLRQRLTPMLAGQDLFASSGGRSRLRDVLISAQIAMSIVLVAGTAVFLRASSALAARDPSVDAAHVMTAPYEPPRGASAGFMSAITARFERLPGVRSIAYASTPGNESVHPPLLIVEGRPPQSGRRVPINVVSASYFETMKRPMLQGRGFVATSARSTRGQLVISDSLARIWWPDGDAIGARIDAEDGRAFDVAGIVHADAPFAAGSADTIEAYTLPPPQAPFGTLFLRFDGDARTLQTAVHDVLQEMSPTAAGIPVTLAAADEQQASKFFVMVKMVGALGISAIVLAVVGIYGVVSFAVGRRTREIGVRIALGATRADIVWMVLSSGAPPIAFGIAAGLVLTVPAAIALTRVFQYAPVSLRVGDPLLYVFVALSLALVAALTMFVPARRASAVAPTEALRTE